MTWWRTWARARRAERGTSVTEYALILAGVAFGMVVVAVSFSGSLASAWSVLGDAL